MTRPQPGAAYGAAQPPGAQPGSSYTPTTGQQPPIVPPGATPYGTARGSHASYPPSFREPPPPTDPPHGSGGFTTERQAALRALRNLEATEARLERNAKREAEEARGKLVQELLPVLDNLDRTIQAAQAAQTRDCTMLEGVRMVRNQLEGVLRGYGVDRIDALDQPFDPSLHEAVGLVAVTDPQRHGIVVEQAEAGYRFAGKLLRPAKVSVGKFVAPVDVAQRSYWR